MPINFPLLLEASGKKVSGVFSQYVTPYFDMIEKAFNATVNFQKDHPGLGDRIGDSNSYDGCLGKLQRGETDFVGQAVDYPLDIVNVSQVSSSCLMNESDS